MNESVHKIIKSEYEKRQKKASDDLLQRKAEIYAKIPRIHEIDNQVQISAIKYNKMILSGAKPANTAINELISKMEKLEREKTQLLTGLGYPGNYLEIKYLCAKCNDTGFIETGLNPEKCICHRQQILDYLFSRSNLKLTETENFSTFDEGCYPDVVDEERYGIRISPRENIRQIKEHCIEFIENFSSPDMKNLFFCGPTGTGKTFMSNCIAMELMEREITVLYMTAPMLFAITSEYRQRFFKEDSLRDEAYDNIHNVELLIIDDLGTEALTAARYAEFLTILNTRYTNNLTRPCKTLISTNIEVKRLREYYDERVVSRIIGCFDMFKFAGEDIRSIKALKGK